MQLTEIVQLVIVSFTALIIVIFFVSYISYRSKKNKNTISSDISTQSELEDIHQTQYSEIENENLNSSDYKISNPKFQVFNPKKTSETEVKNSISKKHFPRTLSVKF